MVILDTHALIWFFYSPQKLSANALKAIQNHGVCVSIASLWEMSIKIAKRKLALKESITEFAQIVEESDISIAGILPAYCECAQSLPFYHFDPFDRIIMAHALTEGIPLITSDELIWKGYPEVPKIW